MFIHEADNVEDIADYLMQMLEQQTKKRVFTMRILDVDETEESVEVFVVFVDKSILKGKIIVQSIFGRMACRIQGNFI